MKEASTAQQISLEILRNPSRVCPGKHLDSLELEDSSLSQLHPLARVIALSGRGRASEIKKELLMQAIKTISLYGICETCEEEDSDDWDLTYYKMTRLRRRSYFLDFIAETPQRKVVKVEFQLGCEMNGGSMDGFTVSTIRKSLSVNDLPLVANLINDYGNENKWIDLLLSGKAGACASLDPGFDNLDGGVAIYLEGVSFRLDDRRLKTLNLSNAPVADLQYSVGELVDTQIHAPIDESSEFGARCFWPKWLPAVAEELTSQLEACHRDQLLSENDPEVVKKIRHTATSIGEWCRNSQDSDLYIDLEELTNTESFTSSKFEEVRFSISSKKYLPPFFKASEHLGLDRLAKLLLIISEIAV